MKPVLSEFDYQVLNLIPRGEGRIVSSEIEKILNASKRRVFAATERLKKNGVPIVAERIGNNKGIYIATTPEEKSVGLVSLRNHAKTIQERVKQVEQSKLNTWHYDLRDPDWRKKATGKQRVQIGKEEFTFTAGLEGDDTQEGYVTIPDEMMNAIKKAQAQSGQG